MEARKQLKDGLKMVVKEKLKENTFNTVDQHWLEMKQVITEAVQNAVSSIKEGDFLIDLQKKDIEAGAKYVAIVEMRKKIVKDCLEKAKPFITQFTNEFTDVLLEATSEAIYELIQEKLEGKRV